MDSRTKILAAVGALALLLVVFTIAVTNGSPAPPVDRGLSTIPSGSRAPVGPGPGPWAELDWAKLADRMADTRISRPVMARER